jgi:predicted Rossmann fold flavoprotein
MKDRKLIVVGGGAAGFFCAVNAARLSPRLKVVIVEKSSKLLSKVRVSGGGRCNVTHSCFDITEMAKRYPRGKNFVKRSFHRFFTTDTISWFEERGVKLKEEKDGRMFPVTDSSETIINCLLKEADKYGVEVVMGTTVAGCRWQVAGGSSETGGRLQEAGGRWQAGAGFIVDTDKGEMYADYVCIAAGGFPKKEQYDWLRSLPHTIVPPSPSLFTFNAPSHPITKLMGVAVEEAEVKVPALKQKERGPLLITHWGLSGPAVIRLSAWLARELEALHYKAEVLINWLPEFTENSFREYILGFRDRNGSVKLRGRSPFGLPQRLWEFLLGESGIGDQKWAELSAAQQNRLIKNMVAYSMQISGKTTFKEEFVTAGGITLAEVDPDTMQSRTVPGLYFAGEILDVDGITGGFNFQHAWTSGFNAANDIAQKSLN